MLPLQREIQHPKTVLAVTGAGAKRPRSSGKATGLSLSSSAAAPLRKKKETKEQAPRTNSPACVIPTPPPFLPVPSVPCSRCVQRAIDAFVYPQDPSAGNGPRARPSEADRALMRAHLRHLVHTYGDTVADLARLRAIRDRVVAPWRSALEDACEACIQAVTVAAARLGAVLSANVPDLPERFSELQALLEAVVDGEDDDDDEVPPAAPERRWRALDCIHDIGGGVEVISPTVRLHTAQQGVTFTDTTVLWASIECVARPSGWADTHRRVNAAVECLTAICSACGITDFNDATNNNHVDTTCGSSGGSAGTSGALQRSPLLRSTLESFRSAAVAFCAAARAFVLEPCTTSPSKTLETSAAAAHSAASVSGQYVRLEGMHFAPATIAFDAPRPDSGYEFQAVLDCSAAAEPALPLAALPLSYRYSTAASGAYHAQPPQCYSSAYLGFALCTKLLATATLDNKGNLAGKMPAIEALDLDGPVLVLGMGGNVVANLLVEQLLAPTAEGRAFRRRNPRFAVHTVEIERAVFDACAANGQLPGFEAGGGDAGSGVLLGATVAPSRQVPAWALRSASPPSAPQWAEWRATVAACVHYHIGLDALGGDLSVAAAPGTSPLVFLDCFDPLVAAIRYASDVLGRFKPLLKDGGVLCVNSHFRPEDAVSGTALRAFTDAFPDRGGPPTVWGLQFSMLPQFLICCTHRVAGPAASTTTPTSPMIIPLGTIRKLIDVMACTPLLDRLSCGLLLRHTPAEGAGANKPREEAHQQDFPFLVLPAASPTTQRNRSSRTTGQSQVGADWSDAAVEAGPVAANVPASVVLERGWGVNALLVVDGLGSAKGEPRSVQLLGMK